MYYLIFAKDTKWKASFLLIHFDCSLAWSSYAPDTSSATNKQGPVGFCTHFQADIVRRASPHIYNKIQMNKTFWFF